MGVEFGQVEVGRNGAVLQGESLEERQEVSQDVFVRLCDRGYRLLRNYKPGRARLSTYLTLVARSTALDHLRRRRLSTVPLEDSDEPVYQEPDRAELPEFPEGLLTGRQKLVLHLLYSREMTVAEVASTLEIRAQTVRSMRHKAVERLRSHFEVGEEKKNQVRA